MQNNNPTIIKAERPTNIISLNLQVLLVGRYVDTVVVNMEVHGQEIFVCLKIIREDTHFNY